MYTQLYPLSCPLPLVRRGRTQAEVHIRRKGITIAGRDPSIRVSISGVVVARWRVANHIASRRPCNFASNAT